MASEPSPQLSLWNVEPKRPAPSTRQIERLTEPGSKRGDPLPSFLASATLKQSGAWHRQLWTVFHGVRQYPGLTAAELTERLGLEDKYIASRRLPEMRDRFRVVCNGRPRRCTASPSRRLRQTWYCARRWIDKPRSPAPTEPARIASPARETGDPKPITTTPEQRREIRRRLASQGDSFASTFTSASSSHDGEGG